MESPCSPHSFPLPSFSSSSKSQPTPGSSQVSRVLLFAGRPSQYNLTTAIDIQYFSRGSERIVASGGAGGQLGGEGERIGATGGVGGLLVGEGEVGEFLLTSGDAGGLLVWERVGMGRIMKDGKDDASIILTWLSNPLSPCGSCQPKHN